MSLVSLMAIDWSAPFYDGPDSLYRTAVTALIMYPVLITAIRVFGKRSVSEMNNFDWIVTVAIGSIVASAIVFEAVTIADAVLSILLLMAVQWAITEAMTRWRRVERAVTAAPTLLVHRGEFLTEHMERERVTEPEVRAAIRASGHSQMGDILAVVLESNAAISVIASSERPTDGSALSDVQGLEENP